MKQEEIDGLREGNQLGPQVLALVRVAYNAQQELLDAAHEFAWKLAIESVMGITDAYASVFAAYAAAQMVEHLEHVARGRRPLAEA
jgi:hypothetical protein